jgi:hypothetical protein
MSRKKAPFLLSSKNLKTPESRDVRGKVYHDSGILKRMDIFLLISVYYRKQFLIVIAVFKAALRLNQLPGRPMKYERHIFAG